MPSNTQLKAKDRFGVDSYVALWIPCPASKDLGGCWEFACEKDFRHAHLVIDTEDGTGFVPTEIESRPYLEVVCDCLLREEQISAEQKDAILRLPEVQRLRDALTERERDIVADPDKVEQLTRYGYVSA